MVDFSFTTNQPTNHSYNGCDCLIGASFFLAKGALSTKVGTHVRTYHKHGWQNQPQNGISMTLFFQILVYKWDHFQNFQQFVPNWRKCQHINYDVIFMKQMLTESKNFQKFGLVLG